MKWLKLIKRYPNGSTMTYHIENAYMCTVILYNLHLMNTILPKVEHAQFCYWMFCVFNVVVLCHLGTTILKELYSPTDYWKESK